MNRRRRELRHTAPELTKTHLPSTGKQSIERGMKGIGLIFMVLSLAGCATTSKFAFDPRSAVVGPDYLDYIAEYPRDRDTEYYTPTFTIRGMENWVDPCSSAQRTPPFPSIEALLVEMPEPSQEVKDITGKGYPSLEQVGILLFTEGYR
jgi:hypothetical protein